MKIKILLLSLALPLSLAAQTVAPTSGSTASPQSAPSTTSSSSSKSRHKDPNAYAEHRLQRMTDKLNLTSEQQSQIKPLLQSEAQQIQAIHSDKSLSKDQRKAQFHALRKSTQDKINPLLTKDQKTKLAQLHRNKKQSQSSTSTSTGTTTTPPVPAAPTP